MNRLFIIASLLISIAIIGIIIMSSANLWDIDYLISLRLLFITLFIFIIIFVSIKILFGYYAKKQIQNMAEKLPKGLIDNIEKIGFKELSEKISGYHEKSDTELDMMKEMETFRKEYIGNISHELKTPLFSIQGYIETLREGGIENLNIRDKYLERIGYSVDRLIAIVNDLDMMNSLEAGEIQLNITHFDLNQIIREVFDLLDLEAQNKEANLRLISPEPQLIVKADQQKISQVLINLISNSIHYSYRKQATISVLTHILRNKVLVIVQDNGMGIKPELLPRIFERFYRVETSRNRKDGGSGLGLSIVKHILEAHGEKINVESEYLEGTKFSFLLPLAQ